MLRKHTFYFLSLTTFLSCFLFADPDRKQIQSRPVSEEIKRQIEDERKQEIEIDDEVIIDQTIQATPSIKYRIGAVYNNQLAPIYIPSHCHNIAAISALGDTIVLEDGSIWDVPPDQQQKVINWQINDPLLITQNHSWFSNYQYKVINHTTKASITTNILQGPYIDGDYSHSISEIDLIKKAIKLNDGSWWQVQPSDLYLIQEWAIDDGIILGTNSSWPQRSPNILININMYNHARVKPL